MKLMRPTFTGYVVLSLLAWNALLLFRGPYSETPILLLGVALCLFLPGLLLAIALGAKRLTLQTALYSVGLSVLVVYLAAMIANFVPTFFGVSRPLDTFAVLYAFDALLVLCYAVAVWAQKQLPTIDLPRPNASSSDLVVTSVGLLGLCLTILGTFRLNNGGDNVVSIIGFCLLIANLGLVLVLRRKLSTFSFGLALTLMSVALLLVTSLRGWYISGQDMKEEYEVYNLTAQAGQWNMSNLRISYNACMSITLFPYALVKLIGISANLMFKVMYQVIFSVCTLAVFSLLRSKFTRSLAYVGTIFFLALPTMGVDLPLQGRQEMGFVMISLAMLAWFGRHEDWLKTKWQLLFITFAAGAVFSHYSTAYMFVGTLLLYYGLRLFLGLVQRRKAVKPTYAMSGRTILAILLIAFFWLAQITAVSSDLVSKLADSIALLTSGSNTGQLPSATNPTLPFIKTEPNNSLTLYIDGTEEASDIKLQVAESQLSFTTVTLKPASILSKLPAKISALASSLASSLYYSIGAKLYQLLIAVGVVYLMRRKRKYFREVTTEYTLFCIAAGISLVFELVLPGITADYGPTRAFIQDFMVLSVPFMVGLIAIGRRIPWKMTRTVIAATAIVLLLNYSGLIAQLFGGLNPQLNFNNAGPYYGAFYTHKSEVLAYDWINTHAPASTAVNASDYSLTTAQAYFPQYNRYGGGIVPFQVRQSDYALLLFPQIEDNGLVYVTGTLDPVYIKTSDFNNRPLIYATEQTQIYGTSSP
jgi:uncharacterized membrane protein